MDTLLQQRVFAPGKEQYLALYPLCPSKTDINFKWSGRVLEGND